MTKEELTARINVLETERDQVKSQYIAYEGAIQEAKYWLNILNKPEDKPEENLETNG